MLSLTDAAGADLTGIRRWLRQPGASPRARQRLLSVERAVAELCLHPCRHPPGKCAGTHEMVVAGHRVVYRAVPTRLTAGQPATSSSCASSAPARTRAGPDAPRYAAVPPRVKSTLSFSPGLGGCPVVTAFRYP